MAEAVTGSVLFCDVCDYTHKCILRGSEVALATLCTVFNSFDAFLDECGVIKVGTIGDAYMVVCTDTDRHAERVMRFAERGLATAMANGVDVRIGVSSGPFLRASFGTPHATSYYGNTVNKASRMESSGFRNCIRLARSTMFLLVEDGADPDSFAYCGVHEVKSYGFIPMYITKHGAWEACVRYNNEQSTRRRSVDDQSLKRHTL